MRRLALALAAAGVLASAPATALAATPPLTGSFAFEDQFTVQPGDTAGCSASTPTGTSRSRQARTRDSTATPQQSRNSAPHCPDLQQARLAKLERGPPELHTDQPRVTVQITQICTVTGLSKRASMAVQNGGSARVLPDTRLSPSVTQTIGIAGESASVQRRLARTA